MKKFAVPVIYRGLSNFIVEADAPEKAQEIAYDAFKNGVEPDPLGNEWESIERVCEPEEVNREPKQSETFERRRPCSSLEEYRQMPLKEHFEGLIFRRTAYDGTNKVAVYVPEKVGYGR